MKRLKRVICWLIGHDLNLASWGQGMDYTVEGICQRCGLQTHYNRGEYLDKNLS